jgi:hypothetical protein
MPELMRMDECELQRYYLMRRNLFISILLDLITPEQAISIMDKWEKNEYARVVVSKIKFKL